MSSLRPVGAVALLLFGALSSAVCLAVESLPDLGFPLAFAENQGQVGPEVRFLGYGAGYSLALSERGATIGMADRFAAVGLPAPVAPVAAAAAAGSPPLAPSVLTLSWPGARPTEIRGREPLGSSISFFYGNDPVRWRSGLPEYAAVEYRDLWPGVDLVFYQAPDGLLEYDFVVAPGADPSVIAIEVGGGGRLVLEPGGGLRTVLRSGEFLHSKPRVYQDSPEGRREVAGEFALLAENRVGFVLGSYARESPLVIDPRLSWSVSLKDSGPPGFDRVRDIFQLLGEIVEDGSGRLYVAYSHGFRWEIGVHGGLDTEVVVRRLDGKGKVQRTAAINGPQIDGVDGLAFHPGIVLPGSSAAAGARGAVYLTGNTTSHAWPSVRPIQQKMDCYEGPERECFSGDAFLTLFDPDLEEILFSTFLGGNRADFPSDLAVDGEGRAYLTGGTGSKNFPRQSPTQAKLKKKVPEFGGGAGAFVAVIDPRLATEFVDTADNRDALVFSTFYATKQKKSRERGVGIRVDSKGRVHVAGQVDSKKKIPLVDPVQPKKGGGADLFVAVWDLGGLATASRSDAAETAGGGAPRLVFSSYFGGEGDDLPRGLDVGPDDRTYVVGETDSRRFPLTAPLQDELAGETDAFVTVFDLDSATSPEVVFSTYFGGAAADSANAVAVDRLGTIHFGGSTLSKDFPVSQPVQDEIRPDDPKDDEACAGFCSDAFLVRLRGLPAPSSTLFSTYLGSGASDHVDRLAVDGQGNTFLVGGTGGLNFPGKGPWKKRSQGDPQIFVARIDK